jgi:hypothetical protein
MLRGWKGIALAGALLAAQPARAAEDPARATSAPPAPARPPREAVRGDEGFFQLRDGRVVEGRLVSSSDAADIIALPGGERLFLPGHSVVSVAPVRERPPLEAQGLEEDEVRVTLLDGSELRGRLLARDDEGLRVRLLSGEVRALRAGEYRAAYQRDGRLPRPRAHLDAGRTRTLWAPTALALDHGEVALTSELLGVALAAGFFDHFALSAGTTLPWGYGKPAGGNLRLTGRAVASLLPWLHLGGGVDGFVSSPGTVVNAFAMVTLGSEEGFLSLYSGPPATGAGRLGPLGDRVHSAAGYWRVGSRLALLAEAWRGQGAGGTGTLAALGARWVGRRFSVDAGLARSSAGTILPFASLAVTLFAP